MGVELAILKEEYLDSYSGQVGEELSELVAALQEKKEFAPADFEHYIQASATYSSNIEGNSIDYDTYLKNKTFHVKSKPKEMAEIDDLIAAYNYSIQNSLTLKAFLEAHKILSRTILSLKKERGKLRTDQVGIFSGGRIEYMAVEPEFVKIEVAKLFEDIKQLLNTDLSYKEAFYYAALIHLVFEKIHPFMDGNGRAGRLLEKWFLASKIGKNGWAIQSEQYYAQHKAEYYEKIHIGYNYYALKMERCVPFLLMLPQALKTVL